MVEVSVLLTKTVCAVTLRDGVRKNYLGKMSKCIGKMVLIFLAEKTKDGF